MHLLALILGVKITIIIVEIILCVLMSQSLRPMKISNYRNNLRYLYSCICDIVSFSLNALAHPCSHKLFTPSDLHVGTPEVFSFTSYSDKRFDVETVVWYEDCACRNRASPRCENRTVVFSKDSGRARLGMCM